MPLKSATVGAIIGSALMALSLVGSSRNPASFTTFSVAQPGDEVARYHQLGIDALKAGQYQYAREAFWSAAKVAMQAGLPDKTAMNWSNAGYASLVAMQYRTALEDLTRARALAESSGAMVPLIHTLNNLASLYLQLGETESALRIAREALAGPAGHADEKQRSKLIFQEAEALADLNRFKKAEPLYLKALAGMLDGGDFDAAARGEAILGSRYLDAGRLAEAQESLTKSLELSKSYHLKATAFALTSLAKLKGRQGDVASAERLFQDALATHETVTPLWVIYRARGQFRLESGNLRTAFEDFLEARRIALRVRADMVPSDQDRVALESKGNRFFEGMVESGNQLAAATNDKAALAETFDAAEQDRLWSLRSLVPEMNDWRSHLPPNYWELLMRFQSTESRLLERPSPALEGESAALQQQLSQAEAAAGSRETNSQSPESQPFNHVKATLDADSVLFSFYLTKTASWLWTVDGQNIRAFRLPPLEQIRWEVAEFTHALQSGKDSLAAGQRLYGSLFGGVPRETLAHKRWLLEPDGPLHDLPFAALPFGAQSDTGTRPAYLIEHAAVQSIPSVLLMERGRIRSSGSFAGIGDPVFNAADPRYNGNRVKATMALPRLPNTADEVEACSRAWGSDSPVLLTGSAANLTGVEGILASSPDVIHFATHVVTAPGEYGSGLIALGLDSKGSIGLMGPKDIAARPLTGTLVVMNGCHSAQGEALPGSGLMGLTRAWIGAGARAVLSTRWDVPDDAGQSLIVNFYRQLRGKSKGNPAVALREAQLTALRSDGPAHEPIHWAGYFLLSRI